MFLFKNFFFFLDVLRYLGVILEVLCSRTSQTLALLLPCSPVWLFPFLGCSLISSPVPDEAENCKDALFKPHQACLVLNIPFQCCLKQHR